ncbi:hypothetical protein [Nonomuraea sp. B5E05]|uniref:hypothetical protein n=1 Tax=Nonomuraea sp. B5E05 TaxID=3153569 RepID=UPI003261732F
MRGGGLDGHRSAERNAVAYHYGTTFALAVSAIVMSLAAAVAALPMRAGARARA